MVITRTKKVRSLERRKKNDKKNQMLQNNAWFFIASMLNCSS